MFPSIRPIFLFLLFRLSVTKSWDIEETLEIVDQFLEANSRRLPRHVEDESPIWMEYEFDSGVGNREDLVVTDISIHPYPNLPEATNWQFFETNDTRYLACAERSILSLYKLNLDAIEIVHNVDLSIDGDVLTFKVINLNSSNVVAVLCVKSHNGTSLQWYKLDGDSFEFFWSWPVQKHVQDMEFVLRADGNKLLLLDDDEIRFRQHYSTVDVYGFSIDFSTNDFHFWLCQRTFVPKVLDIQVCSIYESVSIALQGKDEISLFEYKGTIFGDTFQELKTIKSHNLNNFACFESGYLQFLAISGPEAGLFHFTEGEFEYNTESEANFDISDIYWVKDIRLDTYREESLLLLQLQNSTVIALAWQGLSYKRIPLPNVLDQFNLSMITPVPKFGFFVGNQFVKFHTELKELKHPIQYTTERLLIVQRLLNDTLYHQERILNETETRVEKSYLKNPVITGFWNLSSVNVTNAVLSDNVTYQSVSLGSKNLTKEELQFDVKAHARKLEDLEEKFKEIDSNLKDAVDSRELRFDSDVEIFGNLNITGTLNVNNLTVEYINDVNVTDESYDVDVVEDKMTFSSIEADNLTIHSLNGIPVEDIRFSDSIHDYHNVDFSKINRTRITGHLFFDTINGIDWETLMKNIVWIDRPAVIPGTTIIEGTLSAEIFDVEFVNGLRYPDDYVLNDNDGPVNITGVKSFNKLTVNRLKGVDTLNGIDFDDFVVLNRDNVLKEEITFENLSILEQLQIDGEVTGMDGRRNLLLNETCELSNDVTFLNLHVLGNVTFDTLFMNQRSFDFGDLLLKTEENVEITGTKTFLSDVHMKSYVTVTSGMVNGRLLDEFATLDTEQEFPNLVKILPNVTFGNVTFGAIEKLEALFKENNCLDKIIVFESPITVEELSFDKLNNVSYDDFQRKLNDLQDVHFDNLTVENLYGDVIVPSFINGVDFLNFTKSFDPSNIVDEFEVDRLETDLLNASFINGMSVQEINEQTDRLMTMLTEIFSGNVTLESLRVTGTIKANSVNGKSMADWYNEDQTGNIIFEDDVSIGKLTILGLLNGVNFSEFVSDTVLKTDTNIVVDGHKTFDVVNCGVLETTLLNGRPVEKLFDPTKEQVLTGPVVVNGSITVLNKFDVGGKIDNVSFHDLMNRFKPLGNNTFQFHGDVRFNGNVTIENLYTNGSIQGKNFDSFLDDVVFKDEDNVTISGTKVFENSVTFKNSFTVRDKLNDIDLKRFREKAVFIDKPFSIKSKIVFKGGIEVEKDVAVKTNFHTKSIMGIDVDELRHNVLYLNKPAYITEPMTLTNVTFLSNVQVGKINDIDMSLLIPLHTDQAIPVNVLRCRTVNVENIEILGKINGQDLKRVQETTFMVNGNQNITGHFNFRGHVRMQRDFNAHLLNGNDPRRMISLNSKSKLRGNYIFEKPVYLKKSLRTLGYLNGIDPARWEAVAVLKNSPFPQVVSGVWTVRGDVYFKKGAVGSDIVNGTNITEISNALAKTHSKMDAVLTREKEKLKSTCEELKHLKHFAEKQIYEFNAFDYLQIIEFDSKIVSVHYFELEDVDYMMLSFSTCHMHAYVYTGAKFELIVNVPDFGVVERWSTIRHKKILFFLASGSSSCGRGSVNLWKLENDTFTHVLDFGHNVDSRMSRESFLRMINRDDQMRSVGMNESLEESFSLPEDMKIVFDGDRMLLSRKSEIYEYNVDTYEEDEKPDVLKFKAGLLQKEMILYYDEEISKDRIFIYKNSGTKRKVFQTIKTHRPTSFTVLNFEGSIETLLIFIENRMYLRIYEYKGIQGFVYRDGIRMDVDKLFTLKIRKYANVVKRHCLALIHDNRLTIIEAEMHGEKLDMGELSCPKV